MNDDTKKVDNTIEEPKNYKQIRENLNNKIYENKNEAKRYKSYVENDEDFLRFLKKEMAECINDPQYYDLLQQDLKCTNKRINEFQDLSESLEKVVKDLNDELDEVIKKEREENRKEYEGVSGEDKKVDNIKETDKKVDNVEIIDF